MAESAILSEEHARVRADAYRTVLSLIFGKPSNLSGALMPVGTSLPAALASAAKCGNFEIFSILVEKSGTTDCSSFDRKLITNRIVESILRGCFEKETPQCGNSGNKCGHKKMLEFLIKNKAMPMPHFKLDDVRMPLHQPGSPVLNVFSLFNIVIGTHEDCTFQLYEDECIMEKWPLETFPVGNRRTGVQVLETVFANNHQHINFRTRLMLSQDFLRDICRHATMYKDLLELCDKYSLIDRTRIWDMYPPLIISLATSGVYYLEDLERTFFEMFGDEFFSSIVAIVDTSDGTGISADEIALEIDINDGEEYLRNFHAVTSAFQRECMYRELGLVLVESMKYAVKTSDKVLEKEIISKIMDPTDPASFGTGARDILLHEDHYFELVELASKLGIPNTCWIIIGFNLLLSNPRLEKLFDTLLGLVQDYLLFYRNPANRPLINRCMHKEIANLIFNFINANLYTSGISRVEHWGMYRKLAERWLCNQDLTLDGCSLFILRMSTSTFDDNMERYKDLERMGVYPPVEEEIKLQEAFGIYILQNTNYKMTYSSLSTPMSTEMGIALQYWQEYAQCFMRFVKYNVCEGIIDEFISKTNFDPSNIQKIENMHASRWFKRAGHGNDALDMNCLKRILQKYKINPNVQDNVKGNTLLHYLLESEFPKSLEMSILVMEAGGRLDIQNKDMKTPLDLCHFSKKDDPSFMAAIASHYVPEFLRDKIAIVGSKRHRESASSSSSSSSSSGCPECPICYNSDTTPRAALQNCGHVYCVNCIEKMATKRCPVCRQAFHTSVPIFF